MPDKTHGIKGTQSTIFSQHCHDRSNCQGRVRILKQFTFSRLGLAYYAIIAETQQNTTAQRGLRLGKTVRRYSVNNASPPDCT